MIANMTTGLLYIAAEKITTCSQLKIIHLRFGASPFLQPHQAAPAFQKAFSTVQFFSLDENKTEIKTREKTNFECSTASVFQSDVSAAQWNNCLFSA